MSLLMSRSRSRSYEHNRKGTDPPSPPIFDRKYRDDDSRSGSREMTLRKKRKVSHDRSRSRSLGRYGHKANKHARSRSRSYSPYKRRVDRRRSYSRSPYNDRRRHVGTREKPKKSRCLGVFGLSVYTTKDQIIQIFSKYGPIEHVQVVVDASTGRSRGFCFVYFDRTEDATVARDHCTGMEIDHRRIRVDYSITLRPHEPTPGIYKGRSTRSYYDKDRRRSPSPYRERERRRRRSRSRSYSRERK
ncbi:Transformer-2 sex-determining protein [Pseudolycoriella hygida]|uniref:Transformer-2 sex-determining protein n=1 Tax=Pseudolycoriella hygida TaxID=35572 RepID=A0A9Q0ND03_9DIPT|nr:Transformer-2 sex-determining protein [Pseudolycoriella hygida]